MKYHIENNSVQETLVIPLFGRLVCSERFPQLFSDPEAKRICDSLDYDFADKRKKIESPAGLFGALEVAQRQYDLRYEVEAYLKEHPRAAVVNLGCGLDDTFSKVDNGLCRGYNLDFPDVIAVRNDLLAAGERERNRACDLNDFSWMDRIDASDGAVFFAAGVFYYFKTEDVKALFSAMAERFPGAVLAFDSCNERGAKMMRRTWLKEAGMPSVNAFFSLEDEKELLGWSDRFASVSARSYMRGYRDIYRDVGAFHKLMIRFCDSLVNMKIIKIVFLGGMSMSRHDEIWRSYKELGNIGNIYDGIITRSTTLGRMMDSLIWGLDKELAARWIEDALAPIPADFDGRLLEVPVGTGVLTMPLYASLPKAGVTCLDYSVAMMENAKKRAAAMKLANVAFVQGDAGALPFADESFDLVLSLNGFHAFPDKDAAFRETFRVLRKGGVFCGCFYIAGEFKRTDWFVKHIYVPRGFFTPPFETRESLEARLRSRYSEVEVHAVRAEGIFRCRKGEQGKP